MQIVNEAPVEVIEFLQTRAETQAGKDKLEAAKQHLVRAAIHEMFPELVERRREARLDKVVPVIAISVLVYLVVIFFLAIIKSS